MPSSKVKDLYIEETLKSHADFRYEMILLIENSDIYFSKLDITKPYIPFHWHDSYEIIYNLKGEQTVIIDEFSIVLKEHECYIINPSVLHATRSSTDNEFILVMLPVSFVQKYIPNSDTLRFDLNIHSSDQRIISKQLQFIKVLDDMHALSAVKPHGYQLRFNSLVFEMLFLLLHNFSATDIVNMPKRSAKNQTLLADIINYVYENYTRNISIEEISMRCHLQPQYFCRFFKKNMGKTFLEFTNEVRMYHVYFDILNTDLPINRIVEKNGFRNYDTFLKMFRKKYSCTPKELRSQNRETANKLYFTTSIQ